MSNPSSGGGKRYAFLIAFISAVGGFLFGYDLAMMCGANLYLRDYFQLSEAQFGFTSASAVLGCIVGPFFGAWFCDHIGRRTTLIGACLLLAVGSVLTAIPKDVVTFNLFRIVGGLGVGLCSIASPMYTNEIAPARWRGGLGFMYQLAIVIGSILAVAVALLLAKWLPPAESWRWMFASELVFVAIFAVLLFLVPESPRWLAERGHLDRAEAIFTRIDGPEFARVEIAQVGRSLAAESGSFKELFGPGLRMALFVGLCLALFNNYTGWSGMGGYLTRLFEMSQAYTHGGTRAAGTVTFSPPAPESEHAKLESQRAGAGSERAKAESERTQALFQNLLCWSFMGLMTLLACGLVDRVGRRPLWIAASLLMIVANLLLGGVFFLKTGGWLFLPAVCLCAIPHSFALGPLPWLMMSEIFPTRIRARAVAITTAFIWAVNFAASALFPVLCGQSEHLIGSIAGVFWLSAAVCVLSLLFGVTLMPETKGKTLEEIGEMWTAPAK